MSPVMTPGHTWGANGLADAPHTAHVRLPELGSGRKYYYPYQCCRLIFREITSSSRRPASRRLHTSNPSSSSAGKTRSVNKTRARPEQFVNQYLIWPICEAAGLDYISEWFHEGHGGSIDLYIRNTDQPMFVNANDSTTTNAQSKISESTFSTEQPKLNTASPLTDQLAVHPQTRRPTQNVEVLEYHSFRGAVFEALISIDAVQPQLETERVLWNSSVGKAANACTSSTGNSIENPSTNPSRYSKQILTQ